MTSVHVIDTQRLSTLANAYEREMVQFLRDLTAIPAPASPRIGQEMEKAGFEDIHVGPAGNTLGRIGSGKHVVMMDARADTPGAAGMAGMVYAGKLIHELGMYGDFTLWVGGGYILNEDGIRPDCVLLTGPTNLCIYRGQPGRVEFEVHMPGNGTARLVQEVELLNRRLRHDPVLGDGSIAVTEIRPFSVCLDRRLISGETLESAIEELRSLPGAEDARIEVPNYEYHPAWVLGETHPLVEAAIATYETLFELPPVVGKWTSSAGGAGPMASMGVQVIGFGPGEEGMAQSVPIRHLLKAAQFYAAFPALFVDTVTRR